MNNELHELVGDHSIEWLEGFATGAEEFIDELEKDHKKQIAEIRNAIALLRSAIRELKAEKL